MRQVIAAAQRPQPDQAPSSADSAGAIEHMERSAPRRSRGRSDLFLFIVLYILSMTAAALSPSQAEASPRTAAKDSYQNSFVCSHDSYQDSTHYLRAIRELSRAILGAIWGLVQIARAIWVPPDSSDSSLGPYLEIAQG